MDTILAKMKANADSVSKRGFIELYDKSGNVLAKADSSVLNHFKIGVNSAIFRDSIVEVVKSDKRVIDTIVNKITTDKNNMDTLISKLKANADSVTKSGFIELYNKQGQPIVGADSSVLKYFRIGVNPLRFQDSVSKVIFKDLTNPLVIRQIMQIAGPAVFDTVFAKTKDRADSVGKRGFIELYNKKGDVVSMADSSVLKRFDIGINSKIFRDSTTQVMADSLSQSKQIMDTLTSIIKSVSPGGGVGGKVVVVTNQDYTVKPEDYVIIVTGMTDTRTVTLPDAATNINRMLLISQFTSTQTLKFSTQVKYSDAVTSDTMLSDMVGGKTVGQFKIMLVSDGNDWYSVGFTF
jgi:hypothetical protein